MEILLSILLLLVVVVDLLEIMRVVVVEQVDLELRQDFL
jgi:hypothetical protein